jgi:ketosteroid isomerase-like protein
MIEDAYLEAVNSGAWERLASLSDDPGAVERLRTGVERWQGYHERRLQVVATDGAVALHTHFRGTNAFGIPVELEPLTVLETDQGRVTRITSWHDEPLTTVEVIGEYFRSSNAEDWEAFGAVWSDDAELVAVGGPPRKGRDDVIRAYQLFLGLFGSHEDRVERLVVHDRSATVSGTFLGTNPQGVAIEFPWMDLIDLADCDDTIRRLWHWHDRDRFRKLMVADA